MLAIIQEIGVIQSVIIAACFGFMLGMLFVIVGEHTSKRHKAIRDSHHAAVLQQLHSTYYDIPHFSDNFHEERGDVD